MGVYFGKIFKIKNLALDLNLNKYNLSVLKLLNKKLLYDVVFESHTPAGKRFDVILLWTIILSIFIAIVDSIPSWHQRFLREFYVIEWILTLLFTVEYIVRIIITPKPFKYIFSFWGVVDLLAILPTYLSLLFYGYQYLLVVRILRLLRVFRILRLVRFSSEGMMLLKSLKSSAYKISIFLSTVVIIVILLGTVMYVVEGGENGFTSIPQSVYWAIITLTTVGYGDVVPITNLGKFIASFTMIIGYAIIAVPTGIITVEMSKSMIDNKSCTACNFNNQKSFKYCSNCGQKFDKS